MSKSDSFLANVIKLVGGSAFAQALGILAAPILTRIYGPEAYGISTLFVSITAVIGVIACLRYELAIMLPEKDEDAAGLLSASLMFVFITTAIVSVIIFFLHHQIAVILKAPELEKYLWLTPLMVLISGIFLALNYWNSRTKEFGRLSVTRVIASLGTVTTQLGAGFAGYAKAGGLISGQVVGQAISSTLLGALIWRDDHHILKKGFNRKIIRQGIKRYNKFPLIDSLSALLNTLSMQIPSFLLVYFFSPMVVGYYALSVTMLSMPASLVGSAFAQVFYQKASEANHTNTLNNVTEKVFTSLILFGMFPILLLAIAGKEIIIFIFGSKWAISGVYAQILSIWIFFNFISSPISTLWCVLERQGVGFIFNILLLITRALSIIAGGLKNNAIIAISFYSFSGTILFLCLSVWLLNQAGVCFFTCMKKVFSSFIFCLPMLFGIAFIKVFFGANILYIVLVSILTALLYYVLILPEINKMWNT